MMAKRKKLLHRKTYDVYFDEDGRKDKVVLNAWNQEDLRRNFKKDFKGWKINKIKMHEVS